jgi:hypothetical protein
VVAYERSRRDVADSDADARLTVILMIARDVDAPHATLGTDVEGGEVFHAK